MNGEFSVCQFFEDDTYEYVRRLVDAEEAVTAARHYTDNVAAKMGITKRVIITDGGDCCVFEWLAGKGVVYPTPEMRRSERESSAQGKRVYPMTDKWQPLTPLSVPTHEPVQIKCDGDVLDSSSRTLRSYVDRYGAADHIKWRYKTTEATK